MIDPISDDYKLVHITTFDSFKSEVKVYSLKSNSWRSIQEFPFYLQSKRAPGILANNALHWVVCKEPEVLAQGFILALDLDTEEYCVLESPDHISAHLYLKALEGRLCLIARHWTPIVFDIWIMKEYGVKQSWTKLISLERSESIRRIYFHVLPLAFSKNGDKLLLDIDGNRLVWYDITSKKVDMVSIEGLSRIFQFKMFVDSLVPLNGNGAMVQ